MHRAREGPVQHQTASAVDGWSEDAHAGTQLHRLAGAQCSFPRHP